MFHLTAIINISILSLLTSLFPILLTKNKYNILAKRTKIVKDICRINII